ncbi:MAG TPA: hypothetical protein VK305_19835, partial [Roseateles sp.]|nr:hypothetical protein [Roseateles sp.]
LFTLLEGEVNTLLRIHLRIRGFSPNSITDSLRGTDFDSKIDCRRRSKFEPPCRPNIEPGAQADFEMVGCG